MKFDWKTFVEEHHIDYVDTGASTAKNNIYITCPWCGTDKKHMGLSLTSPAWGCWKGEDHRGRSPVRLIAALLGCSNADAKRYIEDQAPPPGSWDSLRTALASTTQQEQPAAQQFVMPSGVRPLTRDGFGERFVRYLEQRGYQDELEYVLHRYDVQYALTGDFAYRVVLPIVMGGQLVAATGRTIGDAQPKYLTLPHGKAAGGVLYNTDRCVHRDTLVVVEGPLDALRFDLTAHRQGVDTVAVLGSTPGRARVAALRALCAPYRRTVVLLDQDATGAAVRLAGRLGGALVGQLPAGVKDPGDLDTDAISAILEKVQNRD